MRELVLSWLEKGADRVMNLPVYREPESGSRPPVIAHRGAWENKLCVENTMAAFHWAKALGVQGVELDVHFTRDNVAVIQHDPDLFRIFKKHDVIHELTFKELREVAPDLPSLEEALAIPGLHFMIEIKTELSANNLSVLRERVAHLRPRDDFHLLVLRPDLIRERPEFPSECWVLVGEVNLQPFVDLAIEKKYAGVAGHYLGMSKSLITKLHDHGLKAGSGFIPSKNLYNREWSRGIDWVFTNTPSRLV